MATIMAIALARHYNCIFNQLFDKLLFIGIETENKMKCTTTKA